MRTAPACSNGPAPQRPTRRNTTQARRAAPKPPAIYRCSPPPNNQDTQTTRKPNMTHAHTTIATDLIRCPGKLQTALDKVLAADWDGTDSVEPPWGLDSLKRALQWLAFCEASPQPGPRFHSYTDKFLAEQNTGGYISSGDLICAALMMRPERQIRPRHDTRHNRNKTTGSSGQQPPQRMQRRPQRLRLRTPQQLAPPMT